MVNEVDEHDENHEEGEYHFSDEHIGSYDEEESEVATKTPVAKEPTFQENALAIFTKYRRMIIGVVVFFGLIFLVYKMLSPNAQTVPTDFAPNAPAAKPMNNATPAAKTPKPLVPPAASNAPAAPSASTAPAIEQLPQSASQQLPEPAPVPQASPMSPPSSMTAPSAPQTPAVPAQMLVTASPSQASTMPATPQAAAPQIMTPPPPSPPQAEMSSEQNKMINDRLTALENQNAKFMNTLQTQFSQKMTDYQNQNNASEEKIRILNRRLGNIEASLNKMAQLLQDQGIATRMPMAVGAAGLPPARTAEPKMVYTVQAIIPGRAWLKSDAGDTVTVAEGDVLKDYGRITKIDPYDGIVEIDTGSKVVTLSYGSGGD